MQLYAPTTRGSLAFFLEPSSAISPPFTAICPPPFGQSCGRDAPILEFHHLLSTFADMIIHGRVNKASKKNSTQLRCSWSSLQVQITLRAASRWLSSTNDLLKGTIHPQKLCNPVGRMDLAQFFEDSNTSPTDFISSYFSICFAHLPRPHH